MFHHVNELQIFISELIQQENKTFHCLSKVGKVRARSLLFLISLFFRLEFLCQTAEASIDKRITYCYSQTARVKAKP